MCKHEFVSVGTKRFCVKCGEIYGTKHEKPAGGAKPARAKKTPKTQKNTISAE